MNPFSQFIVNRLTSGEPQQVERSTPAFAYGLSPLREKSIAEAIGQPTDLNYPLLYAIHRKHPDVAACVRIWAGGVIGNGWSIKLMDDEDKPTDAQTKKIKETETWMKNPNPSKRFYRMIFETVEHLAITGDGYIQKVLVSGDVRELWTLHPASMRVVMNEHGAIIGYLQRVNGQDVAQFKPEEVSHLALPSIINDTYGYSPLESALESVGLSLQAMSSNRAMFENGLSPSAIALFNEQMKFEEQQKAIEQMKQNHTGAD